MAKIMALTDTTLSVDHGCSALYQRNKQTATTNETLGMSRVMRKPDFAYAKTEVQISCAVTAQLISAFVFA